MIPCLAYITYYNETYLVGRTRACDPGIPKEGSGLGLEGVVVMGQLWKAWIWRVCVSPAGSTRAGKFREESLCAQISSVSSPCPARQSCILGCRRRAVGCGGAQEMGRHDLTPLTLLGGQAYPQEKGAGQKVS